MKDGSGRIQTKGCFSPHRWSLWQGRKTLTLARRNQKALRNLGGRSACNIISRCRSRDPRSTQTPPTIPARLRFWIHHLVKTQRRFQSDPLVSKAWICTLHGAQAPIFGNSSSPISPHRWPDWAQFRGRSGTDCCCLAAWRGRECGRGPDWAIQIRKSRSLRAFCVVLMASPLTLLILT